jgi:2-polyprenyl-3-methyl-5-hydroxy-6-metoxy-1,4-benzoquinol methylase
MQASETIRESVDPAKLEAFMGRMLNDMGAAMSGALILVGDKLGLYRAMAEAGPVGSYELARRTDTNERYVREWLAAQAASGYVIYDPETKRYFLEPEQAAVLADESSPAFMAGAFDVTASVYRDEPKITAAFRSGRGVGWHEHHQCLFCGTERFFRTSYNHHLVSEWLPALDGVVQKLEQGALVADVGCGHGASTILMAQAFPKSRFHGFDYHGPSVEMARAAAEKAGVADRATFEQASAKEFPARGYDLVTFFDCLHDMGDPIGASAHVKETLAPDGTWMVVEPMAGNRIEDNLNPVGRVYYSASTMICTPASMAQEVGLALGAQAGEARLKEVIEQGGFSTVRVATSTPFNMVLEAQP